MNLDIMMPFFGDPEHFRRAVESVIAQEDPHWRLVIVDDVYPDEEPGTWAASLDDPRISYIRNEVNLGVSRNYLKCVDLMEAPYAVMMGCDDIMHPGYVARIRTLIGRFPNASMIQTGVDVIDERGIVYRPLADRVKGWFRMNGNPPKEYRGQRLATNLLHANWTYFPSLCWRVELIRRYGFRPDLNVVQDLQMILTIIRNGGSLVVDEDVNFSYRRHSASVSASTSLDGTRFDQEAAVFREAAAEMQKLRWTSAAFAARARVTSRLNALSQIPRALRAKQLAGARALTRHALSSR